MRFIDFFSGIGGFRLGMEMAGHECVGRCEIDKYADRSYRAMHDVKEGEWHADDITTVEPRELPEADCYCFGFPCQAFSIAGKRRGFDDCRGTLFFEVMRLACERKPELLFGENVAGLLNHEKGRTFGTVISAMDELGYDVEWQVLNSKNFGVPQNRERVFIIGHLRGANGRKVFPVRENASKNTYQEIIGGAQSMRVYSTDGTSVTLSSQGGGGGAKTGLYFIDMNPSGIVTDTARCIQARYHKGVTNHNGGCSGVMVKDDTKKGRGTLEEIRIRRLTPKECFRLQGFPDEYFERARAVNSDTQLYKQAGNSVTVNVIYEIAKRFEPWEGEK